jgi:16S rRNA (adenine1518-N6/adenine1519-N6)-dimethyltransferase
LVINKKHPFKKKWGQNFLRDPNTIQKIIDCLNPKASDNILEIGPGDGALTKFIYEKVNQMTLVEIDPLLIKSLKKNNFHNVSIYQEDILKWNLSILKSNVKVIGNLPYYISSPILFKMLEWNHWGKMVFMFQKELAQRIVASHGNKSYGRISVMVQVYSEVNTEFFVSKNVFQPKPDVNSAVLSFKPKKNNLPNLETFSYLIRKSFSNRRKKIKNNLKEEYKTGKINKWSNLRAEEISPIEFIKLHNAIYIV